VQAEIQTFIEQRCLHYNALGAFVASQET